MMKLEYKSTRWRAELRSPKSRPYYHFNNLFRTKKSLLSELSKYYGCKFIIIKERSFSYKDTLKTEIYHSPKPLGYGELGFELVQE